MTGILTFCVRKTLCLSIFFGLSLLISSFAAALPSDPSSQAADALIAEYQKYEAGLAKSPLILPIHLESMVDSSSAVGSIYGIIAHPFEIIKKELLVPSSWCDIVLLHTNIRACTYSNIDRKWLLTLYNVTVFYQPLSEADRLVFSYRVISSTAAYIEIVMTAVNGPFHTHDHSFRLRAAPLNGNRTFMHVSYSYQYNSVAYLAMKSYFALIASGRAGFTLTGRDEKNNPVYVSGVKGAIERNVMRYYLAFMAYFDSLSSPEEHRYEKRINAWYDLSARYKRQFPEIRKEEYLEYKRADLKTQLLLQANYPAKVK
jgi:hypothetical protein